MPYLSIQTQQAIDAETAQALCRRLSTQVAEWLGKPERYVMVAIAPPPIAMSFAGDEAPCAYIEFKSLGLPDGQTRELARRLCTALEDALGIDGARIYIEFASPERHHWGWNGTTF